MTVRKSELVVFNFLSNTIWSRDGEYNTGCSLRLIFPGHSGCHSGYEFQILPRWEHSSIFYFRKELEPDIRAGMSTLQFSHRSMESLNTWASHPPPHHPSQPLHPVISTQHSLLIFSRMLLYHGGGGSHTQGFKGTRLIRNTFLENIWIKEITPHTFLKIWSSRIPISFSMLRKDRRPIIRTGRTQCTQEKAEGWWEL